MSEETTTTSISAIIEHLHRAQKYASKDHSELVPISSEVRFKKIGYAIQIALDYMEYVGANCRRCGTGIRVLRSKEMVCEECSNKPLVADLEMKVACERCGDLLGDVLESNDTLCGSCMQEIADIKRSEQICRYDETYNRDG